MHLVEHGHGADDAGLGSGGGEDSDGGDDEGEEEPEDGSPFLVGVGHRDAIGGEEEALGRDVGGEARSEDSVFVLDLLAQETKLVEGGDLLAAFRR